MAGDMATRMAGVLSRADPDLAPEAHDAAVAAALETIRLTNPSYTDPSYGSVPSEEEPESVPLHPPPQDESVPSKPATRRSSMKVVPGIPGVSLKMAPASPPAGNSPEPGPA